MRAWFAVVCCALLAACGGGGAATSGLPSNPGPVGPSPQALAATSFTFTFPKGTQSMGHKPGYLSSSIQSVTISLNTVNGGALPSSLTGSVTTNMTPSSCPCTVPGPNVPPGSDAFTISTFDGTNASGHTVSTASATYTIVAGQNNAESMSLNGVPASFTFGSFPSGTAGTSFTNQAVSLSVKDADGNVIVGAFSTPITVTDGDGSGATSVSTSGSDSPPAGKLLSSGDTLSLSYTGLAISGATLSASATGATTGTGTFTPTLSPIVYSGTTSGGNPQIDLYATSGTGSTGSFTASESGWTNSPYNKSLTQSLASGCSTIATASPSSGTSFTVTVVSSPVAGSCNLTLSDGLGQTKTVKLTYTTTTFGVQ